MHEAPRQLRLSRWIRLPEISVAECKLKARRQHAHYGVAFSVNRERLPHYVRVSAKPALPQAISQHRNARRALLVFAGLKRAPQKRFDAEEGKEISRCRWSKHPFRLAASAHDSAASRVSGDFKGLVLLIILIIGIGKLALPKAFLRRDFPNVVEALGRFVGKPTQQTSVDHRENCRAPTDAQCECHDGYQSEARPLSH